MLFGFSHQSLFLEFSIGSFSTRDLSGSFNPPCAGSLVYFFHAPVIRLTRIEPSGILPLLTASTFPLSEKKNFIPLLFPCFSLPSWRLLASQLTFSSRLFFSTVSRSLIAAHFLPSPIIVERGNNPIHFQKSLFFTSCFLIPFFIFKFFTSP